MSMIPKSKFRQWLDLVKKDIGTKITVSVCVAALLAVGAWGYKLPGKAENGQRAFDQLPSMKRNIDSVCTRAEKINQKQVLFEEKTGIKLEYIGKDTKEIKEMVLFLYQDAISKRKKSQ